MQRLLSLISGPLLAHSLAGLLIRGAEVGGKFLLYVAVAHRLGAAPAGLFFVAMNWVTFASGLGRLGLERSLMRHMPPELASGRPRSALRQLRWTAVRVGAGSLVVGGLTAVLAHPAANHLLGAPAYGMPLMLSALVLIPDALAITAGNALIALKRPMAAQLVQNALWPGMAFVCVVAGLSTVSQVLLATAACRAVTLAIALALLWQGRRAFSSTGVAREDGAVTLVEFWRSAGPLFVVELVQGALTSLPTLVLGAFASAALVGGFSAATRLSMLTYVILLSVSAVTAPHFAELHHTGRWAELRRTNRTARLASAGLALPMLAVMMLLAPWLLEFIGPGFSSATAALRVLALGQMVNAAFAGQDILLAMTGHARALRRINLMNLAILVVLSAVAIPALGVLGAAIVTAVNAGFGAAAAMLAARRRLPEAFRASPDQVWLPDR